jgi:hypothetical protein
MFRTSWPPASLAARSVYARTTNGSGAKEGYSSRDGYKNLINLPPSTNRIRAWPTDETCNEPETMRWYGWMIERAHDISAIARELELAGCS